MSAIRARYRRAERMLDANRQKLIFNDSVHPNWIEGTSYFWYLQRSRAGTAFILVDGEAATKRPAFDHERVAAIISRQTDVSCTGTTLPFHDVELEPDLSEVRFAVNGTKYKCSLSDYTLDEIGPAEIPNWAESISPDKKWAAFIRDGNLFVRDIETSDEFALSSDAGAGITYGMTTDIGGWGISLANWGLPVPPFVAWSPDSKYLLSARMDQSDVPMLHLVDSQGEPGTSRPKLHSLHYPMPGDPLATAELVVAEIEKKSIRVLPDSSHDVPVWPLLQRGRAWWSEDSVSIWFVDSARGQKSQRLRRYDFASDVTQTIMEEAAETTVDVSPIIGTPPAVRVLKTRPEFVWFSEVDGWPHLYLHSQATGEVIRQLTSGTYGVRDIAHVDEEGGWLYFHAGGREPGSDPYTSRLYRTRLDGDGEVELLTSEPAHHTVVFSKEGQFLVDSFSSVDTAPAVVLRRPDGAAVLDLERADTQLLEEEGWARPERFVVKAADGVTDLYGVIFKPSEFDPTRRYPVLDSIYPGPQAPRLAALGFHSDPYGNAAAFAELGVVVVTLDGRGTPMRSREFRELSYRNIGSAGYLEDHVAAIKELGARHAFLDLDRVGIYGHSAGGYAAARALLKHPDFFKVGVSSSGNHDQSSYYSVWGETYHGLSDDADYSTQANKSLAENLRGKLLLIHGELDDNVHPGMTLQLAKALMDAGKDFDLLIVPGVGHSYLTMLPYVLKKQWDFLTRHLIGEEPPGELRLELEFSMPTF